MLGSDAASDVVPSQVEGVMLPIHQLVLVAIGIHIFDNCDLEAVAKAAAQRNRWAFLLTAAPLAVRGGYRFAVESDRNVLVWSPGLSWIDRPFPRERS
jgi:hypothetical protein